MSKFSNLLKQIRKNKNMTMVELSQSSGMSQSYISQLENSKRSPTSEALRNLAKGLSSENQVLDFQLQNEILSNLQEALHEDQIEKALLSSQKWIDLLKIEEDGDLKTIIESMVEHLNKQLDESFVSLEEIYLTSNENPRYFTISGEPLTDDEISLLKIVILGIKESRKSRKNKNL